MPAHHSIAVFVVRRFSFLRIILRFLCERAPASVSGRAGGYLVLSQDSNEGSRRGEFIISAAITGGMTVPGQSEAIPITPDEIIDSAVGAHEAGATIVHLHVREPETGNQLGHRALSRGGRGDQGPVRCDRTAHHGRRERMTLEKRAAVLPELEPEMATFNTGSFNFGLFPIAERGGDYEEWEIDYLEDTGLHLPQHLR